VADDDVADNKRIEISMLCQHRKALLGFGNNEYNIINRAT
jgi:hypothetical protein